MNLDEIKEIIEKDKGKFIIVEDGKPTIVVISFDDYKNLLKINPVKFASQPFNMVNPKEELESEEKETNFASAPLHGVTEGEGAIGDEEEIPEEVSEKDLPPELEDEPLKIEDLPF